MSTKLSADPFPVGSGGTTTGNTVTPSTSSGSIRTGSGIPVAHSGMHVTSGLPRQPGDGPDERTIRTQVGETILPAHMSASQFGGQQAGPTDARHYEVTLVNKPDPHLEFAGRQWLRRIAAGV